MNDVFIINLEEENDNLQIEPLADTLKEYNLKTYYTQFSIEESKSLDGLLYKLKSCFVMVLIITEKFIESFLKIFSKIENNQPILPILHNIDEDLLSEKYPLLLDYNYITTKENLHDMVQHIVSNVDMAKNLIAKQDLIILSQNLYKLNIPSLDNVVSKLCDTSLLENSSDIVLNIQAITNEILHDICDKENIYIENNHRENLFRSQVLDDIKNSVLYILRDEKAIIIKEDNTLDILHFINHFRNFMLWYGQNYFKTSLIRHKKIVVANQSQLSHADLIDIYHIETLVYPKEIAGKEEATTIVLENNAHAIAAARDVDTGQIIAFICAYPINDNFYEQLISGRFNDTNISVDDISNYDAPGYYKLYISSVCVHPKYTRTTAFGVIYKSFLQILEDLAKKDIFIEEILADTATKKGAFLCRSLGMVKHTLTDHGTVLYKVSISDINLRKIFGKNKELIRLYKEKF